MIDGTRARVEHNERRGEPVSNPDANPGLPPVEAELD